MIIGVTGGIGSGKSTVARLFGELGIGWVDADDVARDIVAPGEPALDAIIERFGPEVMHEDGTLHRAALRDIVFEDANQRVWLESITHPRIRERLVEHLTRLGAHSPYVLLVSPLLFESGQDALVDRTLVVDVSEAEQIARTLAQDHVSEQQVRAILAAQLPRDERCARADDIIDNSRGRDDTRRQVLALDRQYRDPIT
jgi:dephospho-CoA kinase